LCQLKGLSVDAVREGIGREGLEGINLAAEEARWCHGGYADVPGEVLWKVLRCDASERLQSAAEIVDNASGVPHVVEPGGIEAVGSERQVG